MVKTKRILAFVSAVIILFTMSLACAGCKDEEEKKDIMVYICIGTDGERAYQHLEYVEDIEEKDAGIIPSGVHILQVFDKTGAIGKTAEMLDGPVKSTDIIIPSGVVDNQYTIEQCNVGTPPAIFIRYQIAGSSRLYAFPYNASPGSGASVTEHRIGSAGGDLEFYHKISYLSYNVSEPGKYIFKANIHEGHEQFNPIHCEFTIIAIGNNEE